MPPVEHGNEHSNAHGNKHGNTQGKERGSGQLFHATRYLCETIYEIDYPLGFTNVFTIRRFRFLVETIDPATVAALVGLILVAEDGAQHPLPESLELKDDGHLECTVYLSA